MDLVWGAEGGLDEYLTSGSALGADRWLGSPPPRHAFLALHTQLCFYPSDGAANANILVDIKGFWCL